MMMMKGITDRKQLAIKITKEIEKTYLYAAYYIFLALLKITDSYTFSWETIRQAT